ncbi:MAG: site-specific integrase [Atopobium sp.]|uniref:tyrosine-type recombinase/integrase n=1 Tax=Atopobium sp. TaxID=1872650 RepID=UPI002A7F8CB2|nr:site-specific integrase [Atopobium sp.]MDY4522758.1 site-specific integrase [Atopobium sp.]
MAIDKTPSGKWRVRVEIGRDASGRRKRKSGVFPTKREAKAAEHLWNELARKNVIVRESMLFGQFVSEIYLPQAQARVRYNTYKMYMRDLKLRLLPAFGSIKIEDITHERIQAVLNGCSSYKVATNTRDTLRQVLNEALSLGYINVNPATRRYAMPKRELYPEDHNGDWLTSFAEHDAFIAQIDSELFKTVAILGLSLGLRKGEIFGLNWEDIDLDKRLVHVQRTYVKEKDGYKLMPPKTRKSDRYVPLRKTSAQWLYALYESRNKPTGAVCVNYRGERANPRVTSQRWLKYIRRHNLPYVTMLNMRHSFATSCLMAGMEISKVSRYLGHTSINTTVARYVRYKDADMVDDFDSFTE